MRHSLFTFLFFIIIVQYLQSQSDGRRLVFSITAQECQHLLVDKVENLDFVVDRTPIDTIMTNASLYLLPHGHYLVVKAQQERLSWTVFSHHQHRLYLHEDKKQLNVVVVDEYGQAVKNADLRFEKRLLSFQNTSSSYTRKRIKDGLLIAYLPSDTLFYKVKELEKKSIIRRRLVYFSHSRTAQVIMTPLRWVRSGVQYVKRGVGRGNWRVYHWPFEKLYQRIAKQNDYQIKGYIASNQPVYRIGDTLKLAAYVANPRGRAIDEALQLTINCGGKKYIDTMLMAQEKGHYIFDWVLGDSLKLDDFYSVRLAHLSIKHSVSFLHYKFKVEDYQLDEYRFNLLTKNATFKPHEVVEIKVKVEDVNGLAIPSASVDGFILSQQFAQLFTDTTSVPDTLWRFREEMGNRTQLSLIVPDSIWPLAIVNAYLHLRFQGPSGEINDQQTSLTVERSDWLPLLRLQEDSIDAFISGRSNENIEYGQLVSYQGHTILETKKIAPNTSIQFNPYATHYTWTINNKTASLYLREEKESLEFQYFWLNDSLQLEWFNPRKLPIQWSLRTSNGILKSGSSRRAVVSINLAENQHKRKLWLTYSYSWNGVQKQVNKELIALNKQLQVEMKTPVKIYPGQTENVTINVHDVKGRPVKGVAISAAAYNAQFKAKTPYSISSIPYKGRRKPFVRHRYNLSLSEASGTTIITPKWYELLELKQYLYYRLRFPSDTGRYEYRPLKSRDSLAQKTAQLAPFIVKNGQLLPIYMMYLDNQLVYYYAAWQNTPYSIVASPGYHRLTLRTREGEVEIDSVLLKGGQALSLSYDLNNYAIDSLEYKAVPKYLTRQEIRLLEMRLFFIKSLGQSTPSHFLYQNPSHVFKVNTTRQQHISLGLFKSNTDIHWLRPGVDTTSFSFEPYFSYAVFKNRDRLYYHRPLNKKTKINLPALLPQPVVGREAIFLKDIKAPIKKSWYYEYIEFPQEQAPNRGRMRLFVHTDTLDIDALLIIRNEKIHYLLPPATSMLVLPEGTYTLAWISRDSFVYKKTIYIKARRLSAAKIDVNQCSKQAIDHDMYQFLATQRIKSTPKRNQFHYRNKSNPYINNGKLISGIVTDKAGEPMAFASIHLKGSYIGTVTDLDGYYQLWIPYEGGEIIASYLGYSSVQVVIGSNIENNVSFSLEEPSATLQEVVVTAYKTPLIEQDNSTSAISIRGSRSGNTNYYIDGQAVSGRFLGVEEIKNLPTRNINALAATTAGLSDIGGLESQPTAFSLSTVDLPIKSIRDHFSDYAYWQPILTTDKNGNVTFSVTFPDDITNWRHFALAMDKSARLGVTDGFTSAYLPLQAQLYTPRFLVEKDHSTVSGVLINRSGETLKVNTYLQQTNGKKEERQSLLELSAKEIFELETVPVGIDTLEYTYGLQSGDYRDGEVRQIPVFPIGSKRTVGGYMVLNENKNYTIEVDPVYGPVDMRIGGNGLPQLMKEINWLRDYPYGCNEQTASRLMALLAIKNIQKADTFNIKLEQDIVAMIHRLDKNRSKDGSWGWWNSSLNNSFWISCHVLRALQKANKMGYTIPDTRLAERYLLASLDHLNRYERLEALLFFAEREQVLEYETYLLEYDTLARSLPMELNYRRIQQLRAIPYQLDSLPKYAHRSLTGARYWGSNSYWYHRPSRKIVSLTLKAYELYRDAGIKDSLAAIQQYFMEDDPFSSKRADKSHWAMNTYEASNITEVLLPDLLGGNQHLDSLTVIVSEDHQLLDTMTVFPRQLQVLPRPKTPINMDKSGDGPAFISYYQSYWDHNPIRESNGFTITTLFTQQGKEVEYLKVGKTSQLDVKVSAEADADYVMIEIPVPAGCSYGDKIFHESRWETHREYRRDRVVVFLEKLPKGEHLFSVNLEPRFAGEYTVNPARVEMMYIPNFNGSTGMKRVLIGD